MAINYSRRIVKDLALDQPGSFRYRYRHPGQQTEPYDGSAQFPLYIIARAWEAGVSFEDLADGFGRGLGTQGDWSAIRDSSDEQIERMLERALSAMTFEA